MKLLPKYLRLFGLSLVFTYFAAWLMTAWLSGQFQFHDLTLINDLLGNAVHRGKPFWITDYSIHHFSIHFTPTLFLLMPFYHLSDTQANLLLLTLLADLAFIMLNERILRELLRNRFPTQTIEWASLFFSIFLTLNLFNKTILSSAHFEIFFMPFAAATVLLLLQGRQIIFPMITSLLAFGVRQDGAFYLLFVLVSLLTLPGHWLSDRRKLVRHVIILSTACFAYSLLAIKVMMPHWGGAQDTLAWKHLGTTWPQVVLRLATSPVLVLRSFQHGAFIKFNTSFFFLPLFSPFTWLINSLSGALFYSSTADDKLNLWYYNSAFLFPGMALASAAGLRTLISLRIPSRGRLLTAAAVILTLLNLSQLRAVHAFGPQVRIYREFEGFRRFRHALAVLTSHCGASLKIATDMQNQPFLENRYERFLLRNFRKADMILFSPSQSTLFWSEHSTFADLKTDISRSQEFTRVSDVDGFELYLKTSRCKVMAEDHQ